MWQPTGYLEITPTVAYTVLSEILTTSGILIDEPDCRKIAKVLTPAKIPPPIPMVSIPLDNNPIRVVQETYREMLPAMATPPPPAPSPLPISVSHEQVPDLLEFADHGCPTANFNEVELALLAQCGVISEDNMELSYLKTTLSLSMMEAEFLRMQLRLFNLKARSILELFQYCEGSNAGFCRCPDIRKRVYEMGILVQRQ
ncbi:uncharacterized protein LOC135700224 [Ochlerotatus camptorhynchus]|uniref:uncharacterized protein LOC135700224 n=1 Tax=Ochlerotatus camptorhynchus TaxID=644619 RepID=UPI0031D8B2B2